jgi:hypothetical protein
MGIAAQAPRGGLAEQLAGASRVLVLRNAEIERFEDRHGGIFAVWDGFFGRAQKPTTAQVRDLVALGLVGGGLSDAEADRLISGLGPEHNLNLYRMAQALIGVAFLPDSVEGGGDEPEPAAAEEGAKKTPPAPGA